MSSTSSSSLDATVSTQIFRKDHAIILAMNRVQALLLPIRVIPSPDTSDGAYVAGTVLARNTTSGYYQPYHTGGASGTGTAACVLMRDTAPATGDTDATIGIFGGVVFQAKLTGLDAGGITNLGAKSITDALGTQLLSF